MKKLLLIPMIMLGSAVLATDYNYEVTPLVGYNFAEGNLNIKDHGIYGAELQYNGFDFPIKPELSFFYSDVKSENITPTIENTNIYRSALNGVYEYEKIGFVTPLVKAGLGYETMNNHYAGNEDSMFGDVGAGVKIPFSDALSFKLEAIYMLKNNANRWDNNTAVMAGLNFAFGAKADKPAPAAVEPTTLKPTTLKQVIETKVVDACPPKINLHINFKLDSSEIEEESMPRVDKFSELLKCTPEYKAEIIGHTDSIGTDAYNLKLSQRRADAVKDEIVKDGIAPERITTTAKGESEPIATNKTNEGRAENRRIEAQLFTK